MSAIKFCSIPLSLKLTTLFSAKWTEFRVKYSPVSTGVGVDSFWTIHKWLGDALVDGYLPLDVENSLGNKIITLCYKTDYRVCPLYDSRGTIAGMMLAVRITNKIIILHYDADSCGKPHKMHTNITQVGNITHIGLILWVYFFLCCSKVGIYYNSRVSAHKY